MLDACANLYREFIKLSLPPPVVDEMELWQIAALLIDDETAALGVGKMKRDLTRETIEAHRRGAPPPEPEPTQLNPLVLELFGAPTGMM